MRKTRSSITQTDSTFFLKKKKGGGAPPAHRLLVGCRCEPLETSGMENVDDSTVDIFYIKLLQTLFSNHKLFQTFQSVSAAEDKQEVVASERLLDEESSVTSST